MALEYPLKIHQIKEKREKKIRRNKCQNDQNI